MALYESVFIARQDVSSSQVDALADSFQKIIEDGGGQVAKREYWGLRSLAYKIKKNRKGHYVLFNIDSPSEAVMEYERNMKLNEDILRYMTLRVDELDPEPSVVMQGRGRGERGERGKRFDERPRDGDRRPQAGTTEAVTPAETTAAKPTEAAKPDAESADEKAPKSAAKTAKTTSAKKTDDDKKDDDKKKDAKPAKSEEPAPDDKKKDAKPAKSEEPAPDDKKADDKKADDKKTKKAAPAKQDAPAKEDKKPASVKKTAATKKKGEEA